uniref:Adhesion G-protein coupled receptor G2 n=1 Tax=Ursus maritimus TaxID=29073 RepID=A0A452U0C8_URSMA
MFFSGRQCGHVGRPEELLLMFKIFLIIICLHVVLVTSLEGKVPGFCFVLFFIFSPVLSLCMYVLTCLTSWVVSFAGFFCTLHISFQFNNILIIYISLYSTLNCTFTIKMNKTMNICAVMVALKKVKIQPMEQCCCSVGIPCPSSPEELGKLQCDLQDPVVCLAGHSDGSLFSSSNSIPVVPRATILSQVSSAISFAEPLNHPPVTQSPPSPTRMIHLPSPQPSAPLASSSAIDMPPSSGTFSSPMPQTDLSHTLPPVKSSLSSPTASAPVNVIKTSTPPDKTEIVYTSSVSDSDLENQVSQMEKALSLGSLEPNLAGEMINHVSKLLHSPPALLAPLAQRLLKIVDDIGLQLNFSTKTITLTSPSLALAVIRVNASNFDTTTFAAQDPANLQVSLETRAPENSIGVITLPSSLMSNLPANDVELASRVQFNFFETPALFQDPALENLSLISYVISSSVANLTVKNLTRNVMVTLKHINPSQDDLTVRCVFWDLGRNGGRGGWSSDGCSVQDRKPNETTCACSHLTSFGVLLDLSRTSLPPSQMMALTFITYIGCGLSSIFLSVTLVTYLAFEKIRRDYPSKILIQLSLYDMRGLCISVAVFLHYFLLVSFTWMGLEAFHMYLALVKVFNTYIRKYILKFCIVGWGVPAVVVTIVLAISPNNYGLGSYGKFPNGSPDDFCWINSNAVFYITVVGYFCVIFLLNISMFIVVLVQLCRIKKKKQLGAQRKTSIQDLRSVAGLTFLLGITWGFAFFAWGPVNVTFMYLFAIFNTLQGFFIFIFYCVAKENVRKQWRRYLCCGKLRLAENSGNASTEKNGVSFSVQNGDVCLHDFTGKQHMFTEKEDSCNGKSRIALRRTSKRGSLHFIEQM